MACHWVSPVSKAWRPLFAWWQKKTCCFIGGTLTIPSMIYSHNKYFFLPGRKRPLLEKPWVPTWRYLGMLCWRIAGVGIFRIFWEGFLEVVTRGRGSAGVWVDLTDVGHHSWVGGPSEGWKDGELWTGDHETTYLGGIKQCKCRVIFPYYTAWFGLVI